MPLYYCERKMKIKKIAQYLMLCMIVLTAFIPSSKAQAQGSPGFILTTMGGCDLNICRNTCGSLNIRAQESCLQKNNGPKECRTYNPPQGGATEIECKVFRWIDQGCQYDAILCPYATKGYCNTYWETIGVQPPGEFSAGW